MHLKSAACAALFLAAIPALAQPQGGSVPTPPAPPKPLPPRETVQQATQMYAKCLTHRVEHLAPEVDPETGAEMVVRGCSDVQTHLEAAIEALIAELPAERQAEAREHARTQLGRTETYISEAIRQQREAAAATEKTEPAPTE